MRATLPANFILDFINTSLSGEEYFHIMQFSPPICISSSLHQNIFFITLFSEWNQKILKIPVYKSNINISGAWSREVLCYPTHEIVCPKE